MKTWKLLLLSILVTSFASCSGQNREEENEPGTEYAVSTGDTVSEMSNDIWVVYQDRANNYWFGSDRDGVYRYDGKTMIHFLPKDGLCSGRVREIKGDKDGNVYMATLEAVCKYDGLTFTTLPVANGKDAGNNWKLEPNDIWLKGKDSRLCRYDGKMLYYLEFPKHYLEDDYIRKYPKSRINPYEIYYIYKDKKGSMWFGTGAFGLYRYDGKTLGNLYEKHLTETKAGGSFGIRSIMEDKEGKFWICNTKYRYNILPGDLPEKGAGYVNYTKEAGITVVNDAMGGDRMYYQTIVEDSTGDLWMQTYADGIWRYDG